jgi:hypothetical protein
MINTGLEIIPRIRFLLYRAVNIKTALFRFRNVHSFGSGMCTLSVPGLHSFGSRAALFRFRSMHSFGSRSALFRFRDLNSNAR